MSDIAKGLASEGNCQPKEILKTGLVDKISCFCDSQRMTLQHGNNVTHSISNCTKVNITKKIIYATKTYVQDDNSFWRRPIVTNVVTNVLCKKPLSEHNFNLALLQQCHIFSFGRLNYAATFFIPIFIYFRNCKNNTSANSLFSCMILQLIFSKCVFAYYIPCVCPPFQVN